jgi:hypothetical protein
VELQTKLIAISNIWVAAHCSGKRSVSLETLSSRATSDGKLFRRLHAGRPIYVTTLERVFAYLATPEHWPRETVPSEAAKLLHSPVLQAEGAA